MKQNLSKFSLVIAIGRWKSDEELVEFANAVLTVSNTYFLVPFYIYCSGQLIHCLKISGNKNNLRTFRG